MENSGIEAVTVETTSGSREGVTVLKVSGPLTIRNFFDFQEKTRSVRVPVLIIDLSGVTYMDSAALGSLLGVHVSYGKNKSKYALIGLNQRLLTMFTVCGVRDILVTFKSLAEAEAALL